MHQKRLVLIGYGVMGSAALKRAVAARVVRRSDCVIVRRSMNSVSACRNADIVLLAVKPQDAPAVFVALRGRLHPSALVISIMAGVTIRVMRRALRHERIIRAMPNTPAQIGMGMTVWTKTRDVTRGQTAFVRQLFSAMGEELFVADERLLDAATAVSGSGPAYVFAFAEAMIRAAQSLGFSNRDATTLVLHTLTGSAALWENSGEDMVTLRQRVASKKGTTAAALRVLTKHRFNVIVAAAISAAHHRAREISRDF